MANELEGLTEKELEKVKERFWKFVNKKGEDECWVWTGCRGGFIANNSKEAWKAARLDRKRWYGGFSIKGKLYLAHRISYAMANGPIAAGYCVLHTCDNPNCVHPGHLFLGTIRDNNIDAAKKGRHPQMRLTADEVIQIKQNAENKTAAELAKIYNVKPRHIYRIRAGERWGWLNNNED